jgi:Leucine-rich repeat (LRR) protein
VLDKKGVNALLYASDSNNESASLLKSYANQQGISLEIDFDELVLDHFKKATETSDQKGYTLILESLVNDIKELPDDIRKYNNLNVLKIKNTDGLKSIPTAIEDFKELTQLSLVNLKSLTEISEKIGTLTNLIILEIDHCWKLKSIPESIGNLHNLKKLIIRRGDITSIPDSISKLINLEILEISGINITLLPDLSNLKKLKKLDIAGLSLVRHFPKFIFEMPDLVELSISNNLISVIPRRILDLKLKKLNYQKNPLIFPPNKELKGGFKGLINWFKNNPTVDQPSGVLLLDDGNQDKLNFDITISHKEINALQLAFPWSKFNLYDNLFWKYIELLLEQDINFNGSWIEMNRSQKAVKLLTIFIAQVDNGGIHQFFFNHPELCFAASESISLLELDDLNRDYKRSLGEFIRNYDTMNEARHTFSNEDLDRESRFKSFTESKSVIPSGSIIEDYFYNDNFKKGMYKKVSDYIENNLSKFCTIEY